MKWDLDKMLSYQTLQVVRVRDWRLGMLYYASSIAVAIYITWSIVDGQLWMQQESPSSGSIRVSLREPRDLTATTDLSYCTAGKRGFMAGVQCAFIPGQVVAPSVEEGATFITTRVSISSFARNPNCAATDLMQSTLPTTADCALKSGPKTTYFIADIERYTLMLAHTVQGVTTNITLRSQDMNGALVDAQGNTVDEFEADINSHGDIFSVGDILRVANGVDLDDVPASEPENTLRYDGIVLVMYIRYYGSNDDASRLAYEYSVRRVPDSEFKYEEPIYAGDGSGSVTILNRHGIRLVIKQIGSHGYIGHFDFLTLLVRIVAAGALLRGAVFLVEFFMLYVIPEKKMYRKAVIVDTTRRQAVHRKHGSDRMDGVDGQPEHGLQYTEGDAAVEDVLRGEDSSASIVVVVSDAMSERRHDDTVAQESSGTLDSSANLLAGSSVVASTNVIGHRSPMSVRVHRNVL